MVDINDETQKLTFYRDEADTSRAAAAMESVHAMQVTTVIASQLDAYKIEM